MKGKRDKIAIQKKDISIIYLLPLIVAVSIIPLIVYLNIIELQGIRYETWTGQQFNYDFFSYYKSSVLIITSAAALLLLAAGVLVKEVAILKDKIYVPLSIFLALTIASSVLSEHRDVAFFGYVERYEGMLAWLAYLILLIAAVNILKSIKQVKVIILSLFLSATVAGIIGLGQFFGFDFFSTQLGLNLIVPELLPSF